jgi:ubiquinone/menaquinone biosynthesis C-methylase UbiE
MNIDNIQKQKAIDTHSDQAELFANRYKIIAQDPYKDSFVYSRKRLNEWLDKYMPANGNGLRLADIGCGTGYHLERYKERGFEITGVDGSEEMLKQARLVNPEIEFLQSDVDQIPLQSDSYDFALNIEVLRYLPDINPCIKEIYRILKPGGTALVTAAPLFQANLYPVVNKIVLAAKSDNFTKLRQYFHTSGELRKACLDAGFKDVEIHGVYVGNSIWLERILPSIVPTFLKYWEKIDSVAADAPVLKHLSNMFLVVAKK